MCEPTTAMMVMTAISMYGQIKQGETQAEISNANAAALDTQAQRVAEAGSIKEQAHRAEVQKLLSAQTAQAGASGADVASQSFKGVMEDTAVGGEFDALQLRTNALRDAWGLQTQAKGLRWAGSAARQAGYMGAAGSALTGFIGADTAATKAGGWGKVYPKLFG